MSNINDNETQIIFTFNERDYSLSSFFSSIKSLFLYGGYKVFKEKSINYTDTYYDSVDGYCIKSQNSLRVRQDHKGYSYVIKRPARNNLGIQNREEVKGPIKDEAELELITRSNFSEILSKYMPSFLGVDFEKSVIISNSRREFSASKNNESYKIRLDTYQYKLPNSKVTSKPNVELEIKVVSTDSDEVIGNLRDDLIGIYPHLKYLHASKFSRAESFVDKYQTSLLHKLYRLTKDHAALAIAITILGTIGSIASIIGLLK